MDRFTKQKTVILSTVLLSTFLCLFLTSWSQFQGLPLTESMRAAQEVSNQLGLDEDDSQAILLAAIHWDACLTHWTQIRDSIETSSLPEEKILEEILPIQNAIGDCRRNRLEDMRSALNSSDRIRFDSLSLPERPQVLHFGIHNRLDCNLCATSQNHP